MLLSPQFAVARVLAESDNLVQATPKLLEALGEALGWEVGAIWTTDEGGERLRCVETWQAPGVDVADFRATSLKRTFTRGVGLPGRVWEGGEPAWIVDVREDDDFPRYAAAARAGLHSAFAFPISSGGRTLGLIEFFAHEAREPDEDLLRTMASVGSQVGQFMERREFELRLLETEARNAAILSAALDCIITMDHNGYVVEFNPAAERTFGYTREEAVGSTLAELIIPPDLRDAHQRGLRRYLKTGEGPVMDRRIEINGLRADGSEFPVELAITRIGVGDAPLFTGFLRDISERKRAEEDLARLLESEQRARGEAKRVERLEREARERAQLGQRRSEFLGQASALLDESLDYEETLEKVAQLTVPDIADWCAVDVVDYDGALKHVAMAHVDPSKVELGRRLQEEYPADPEADAGVPKVVRTGEPEIYPEIPATVLEDAAEDEEHRELLRTMGMKSVMIVPMAARDRALGAVTLVSSESGRRFGDDDLALAHELARRAANAVDNARLYRERSYIARTLQESLLPSKLPEIPGVELATRYRAAGQAFEVGGDFYDVFDCGRGTWAAVIGDVVGKGPEAATLTALARHTMRAVAMQEDSPAAILRVLNQAILRQDDADRFCTVAYARVAPSPRGTRVRVVSGGHPLPLVVRHDGRVEATGVAGTLIGCMPEPDLTEVELALAPGEAMLLYTDGVTEARTGDGGEMLDLEGLEAVLRDCAGLDAAAIAARVYEAAIPAGETEPHDDVAVLVLRPADA